MKLTISKDEMLEKLANIQNIIEKKNTMPILSHFLLHASKKGSYIIATDIETAIKEPLEANIEKEGKLCIPARKLFEIVREVEGDLYFESLEETTAEGWLKIRSGASNFKIATLPSSDFPAWPNLGDVEELLIDAEVLLEMIEKTLYSAGESDTRYTLNGLLFHMKPQDKNFIVVGTDGHRLALIKRDMESEMKSEKKIIVPRKGVSELRKFLADSDGSEEKKKVKISIGEKHLLFSIDKIQFLTRLIEGSYPNYENVIPQSNEKKMFIGREPFIRVLRRVSVMSKERASAVKFDLDKDTLTVSSSSPDIGEAKEEVAIEYKFDKLSLGFNARYVLDVLGGMSDEKVVFEFQDPLSPVLVKEAGNEFYQCVIMPMRI
ncbi:MAG: DNA polymerase III subunit beta [Nitrospirae bacterium]|nr:DNA polymerase III subunit beta [Nitrospirota bacterium]